jgi:predicted MPP superfamily phosphohydrolase
LTGLYTWQIEPYWLEYVHLPMPLKNLPDAMVGKRIMQISDIHVGNRFDYQYIIESFKEAQAMAPDILVYTGDYVSYEGPEQIEQLKSVMEHTVIGSMATVGILGNHDYGDNWAEDDVANTITNVLEAAGINMLRNTKRDVEGIEIIGLEDFWGTRFDPKPILSERDSDKAGLVLCHNPDVADLDVWQGYDSWILSGHTHGGQCKPPFLDAPILPVNNRRYTAGKIDLADGRTIYINRALGHLFPIRFNVRPEITVFELEKA